MVAGLTNEDVRDVTDATLFVGVILARARLPTTVIIDVGFPGWVPVA